MLPSASEGEQQYTAGEGEHLKTKMLQLLQDHISVMA